MDKIDDILSRRVAKVLPDKKGLKALMQGKKIRLYQGFDPTGGRLHLGHSVGIRKLMDFANAGHEVIFLFGTGTVLVGDPSQRDTGRKLITQDEIDENIKGWKDQVAPLVDFTKVKIMQNGDWLTKLDLKGIINIASKISSVQLFKRESFQRRIKRGDTVWYHETMYPLLQGYDSVAMDVDLEIGGTDQEFNMLVGRELMRKMLDKEKYVLTTPMIMGTDGQQMSKSTGNCVWLNDTPEDMYGKLIRIPDDQIVTYLEMTTNMPMDKVQEIDESLQKNNLHPLEAKKLLARTVVTELHDLQSAHKAEEHFEKTFQKGEAEFNEEVKNQKTLVKTLAQIEGMSNTEVRRLLSQNAVDVDGETITDPSFELKGGEKIKVGKRVFVRVV
jgi:tyrosyl-tRNA synthetase